MESELSCFYWFDSAKYRQTVFLTLDSKFSLAVAEARVQKYSFNKNTPLIKNIERTSILKTSTIEHD